jgi:hypothetical protein
VAATNAPNHEEYVNRSRRLEYFTIGYNSLEGVTSIVAGLIAGSVSLVGFGLDSLIEVTSGATLLWRLRHDLDISRREQVERIALRMVGALLRCAGGGHPLRIERDAIPARSPGAQHCRHRDRRHFGDRHAAAGPSETASCEPAWQRSDARRFKTGRLL